MSVPHVHGPTGMIRLIDHKGVESPALTFQEARELAHCRIAWRACKADASRLAAEALEERSRRILWWLVTVACTGIAGSGFIYLASTEFLATVALLVSLVLLALATLFSLRVEP